jgi:hypothetical protein
MRLLVLSIFMSKDDRTDSIARFSLYGKPSLTEPWGYSLFGHHLSLNIFVLGKQITASPIFLGAEPNVCLI